MKQKSDDQILKEIIGSDYSLAPNFNEYQNRNKIVLFPYFKILSITILLLCDKYLLKSIVLDKLIVYLLFAAPFFSIFFFIISINYYKKSFEFVLISRIKEEYGIKIKDEKFIKKYEFYSMLYIIFIWIFIITLLILNLN